MASPNRKNNTRQIAILIGAALFVALLYILFVLPPKQPETMESRLARSEMLDEELLRKVEGRLAPEDLKQHTLTAAEALEAGASGLAAPWQNAQTGVSGSIVPQNLYMNEEGLYCREYQQSITIDDSTYEAVNHACRTEDGAWRLHSPPAPAE